MVYRRIASAEDTAALQCDLDLLMDWASVWQMSFNVAKCNVMRVTNAKKNIIRSDYLMGGERLE